MNGPAPAKPVAGTQGRSLSLPRTGGSFTARGTPAIASLIGLFIALVLAATGGCRQTKSGASAFTPQPETPQRIYALHCLGCHGAKGEGAMGSNIQSLSRSLDQIVAVITNGRGKMPAYGGHLSIAQMRALAAYVKTFKFSK